MTALADGRTQLMWVRPARAEHPDQRSHLAVAATPQRALCQVRVPMEPDLDLSDGEPINPLCAVCLAERYQRDGHSGWLPRL